jgi:hypothetical protein
MTSESGQVAGMHSHGQVTGRITDSSYVHLISGGSIVFLCLDTSVRCTLKSSDWRGTFYEQSKLPFP